MKLSTLGAVLAAIAVSAAAGAQTKDTYQPIGASFRLGAFFPTNSTTSDETGSGFVAFGADYKLNVRAPRLLGLESSLGISVDYFHRDDVGNIPVLLNYYAMSGNFYFEGGVGVGFESVPGKDQTGFTYSLGGGYNIPSTSSLPLFVQANFFGADRSRVNGVAVYVGVKF